MRALRWLQRFSWWPKPDDIVGQCICCNSGVMRKDAVRDQNETIHLHCIIELHRMRAFQLRLRVAEGFLREPLTQYLGADTIEPRLEEFNQLTTTPHRAAEILTEFDGMLGDATPVGDIRRKRAKNAISHARQAIGAP